MGEEIYDFYVNNELKTIKRVGMVATNGFVYAEAYTCDPSDSTPLTDMRAHFNKLKYILAEEFIDYSFGGMCHIVLPLPTNLSFCHLMNLR